MPRKGKSSSNQPSKKGEKGFDRAAFFAGVSSFNDEYQTASVDFEPPDGEYVCELKKINCGEFKPKKGKLQGTTQFYASPQFEILEGNDLEGCTFGVFASTMVLGIFKEVFARINGQVIDDIQAAIETAEEQVGEQFAITVSTGKKGYKNYRISPCDLEDADDEESDD